MPFIVRKIRFKDIYTVKNSVNGRIYSYHTTLASANAQVIIMNKLNPLDYLRNS